MRERSSGAVPQCFSSQYLVASSLKQSSKRWGDNDRILALQTGHPSESGSEKRSCQLLGLQSRQVHTGCNVAQYRSQERVFCMIPHQAKVNIFTPVPVVEVGWGLATDNIIYAEGTISGERKAVLLCSRGTAQNQDLTINTDSSVELRVVIVVVKKRREGSSRASYIKGVQDCPPPSTCCLLHVTQRPLDLESTSTKVV